LAYPLPKLSTLTPILEAVNFPVRQPTTPFKMTKRTKKVGITGKYGTRYGASLRKQVKKMEVCAMPLLLWRELLLTHEE
jgi:hypothetical protein